ncbi:receptor-like protein 13 [Manihot esculenta]|uniref:receptor-like protein 13 n=1 Tax=Manihot esculenta TaxID=3983 RepID=UPI001CC69CFF|nr:receptor-like protein 13 [Manihot esculenta]
MLDISYNDLSGNLPLCLANLTSLRRLYLSFNHFIGNISSSPLRDLINLEYLSVSGNLFQIPISLSPFFNHSKFKYMESRDNKIFAETNDQHLNPRFQLERLVLSSGGYCGVFPKFLYYQHNLQVVDLSHNQMREGFPSWLLQNNTKLEQLYLINNSLSGPLKLPIHSHMYLSWLDISDNFFQDFITPEIGTYLPRLRYVKMSGNGFSGSLPSSLGNMSLLAYLDLSNNKLSGNIPEGLGNMHFLRVLDLSMNNISGSLPSNFCSSKIKEIYLSRNGLQGSLEDAFYGCSELIVLDLGHNHMTGSIPSWIGEFSQLSYLILGHNHIDGEIPVQLCNLTQLSLLDLSHNHFSGEIPPEIGTLSMIKVLNLSYNKLIGAIPPTFSNLGQIESLDLSYNNLEGKIPPQLTQLYSLAVFNVAHNNLSGKTPERVAQFATFDQSSYEGNPLLCGLPLPKSCNNTSPSPPVTPTEEKEDNSFMDMGVFYVSFVVSYIMVLLAIAAILYINPYWRRRWFYFIETSLTGCYYFLVDNITLLSKFGLS